MCVLPVHAAAKLCKAYTAFKFAIVFGNPDLNYSMVLENI